MSEIASGGDEVELKLELDACDVEALLGAPVLAGVEATEREQVSTYFDTPDGSLRAAGLSLRVRRMGDHYVQTLKADGVGAGLFARPEWEREVPDERPDLDDGTPLRALVSDAALARIAPAFTVRVARRLWRLTHGEADIELVLDRGEVVAGDRATPVCEVELELKDGPPDALFALARALGQVAPLRLGVLTKAERGYRLIAALETRAVKAGLLTLGEGISVAAAFAAIVGNCVRQFRLNEDLLRADGGPEALHQARVGLRRLRSALSVFKPVVADERFEHLAGELRWIAATLGQARDLDVLRERLAGAHADRLEPARDEAYAAVADAFGSDRLRTLMIDLTEWVALGTWRIDPPDPSLPAQSAERFASETLDRLRRHVKRCGHDLVELSDEDRHELRIQAKKLRYATGFFASLFTGGKETRRAKAFGAALELLQEKLGDLNDLATAPLTLARIGIDVSAEPDPEHRTTLIEEAAEAHDTLIDAKRFWR